MKKYLLHISLGLLAFIYCNAGAMKTFGAPEMVAHLNELHINTAWRVFIGITELLGVIGIFWPRTRAVALLCLWPYAIGGLALHVSYADTVAHIIPAVVAAILVPMALSLGGFINLKPKTHE